MLSTQSTTSIARVLVLLLTLSGGVQGRYRWMERSDRPVVLHPRRFGQEHPPVIDKLSSACGGGVCATLAGQAITPLLAAQPECSQQDMADLIIDTAQQFDNSTKATMIAVAKEYRQVEKNTPPDFTANPPINRSSVFCQKPPKNLELNGLFQAQDPANDPDTFFDPATKASVKKGAQANTFPLKARNSPPSNPPSIATAASSTTPSAKPTWKNLAVDPDDPASVSECPLPVTVTVTGSANPLPTGPAVTVTVGSSIPLIPAPTSTAYAVGNFGSCTLPQIEFGVGFDNRKETSFQPADKSSFNHDSAQNIDIITQFICDTLVNNCGADQTAKTTCATAKAAADQFPANTGAQADAFNAVFGLSTSFAQVPAVDNNGNIVPGSTTDSSSGINVSSSASPSVVASATVSSPVQPTPTGSSSLGIGNFGSCSVPQIEFGAGFDGRKETSFQPTDKTSYNHGSAQSIDTISQFMCDALTNTCKADQTAKDTCAKAQAAADGQTVNNGAQADAFNAVFGTRTNFAGVVVLDDQGRVISGGSTDIADPAPAVPVDTGAAATSASEPVATSTTSVPTDGNLQTFSGTLGGVTPPAVTALANEKFQVDGNSVFNDLLSALTRSCDVQHNQCANAANASGNQGGLTVAACGDQQNRCNASH